MAGSRKAAVQVSRAGVHRLHTFGQQRGTVANARSTYLTRPMLRLRLWGALITGTSAECGIQWWSDRAKIAHAYQKREIDLETCARKLAFFGAGLRGTARAELLRRAAVTILRRRKADEASAAADKAPDSPDVVDLRNV